MMAEQPHQAEQPQQAEPQQAEEDVFDPAGIEWTSVSPGLAAVRRTILMVQLAVVAAGLIAAAFFSGWVWFWIALLIPVLAAIFGWTTIGRQVAAWGYAERADDLLIKRGLMFRALVVVPYGRMQFVDVQAGPLERAFDVAQVQLHTASAGSDARIPGLNAVEAARLRDRLASRGQARLAGL
jgi:membrane protein YdbS with pleckstrin-like domain